MTWMAIAFDRDGFEEPKIKLVQDTFEEVFTVAGAPEGCALFIDPAVGPSPIRMYFSPSAARLLDALVQVNHGYAIDEPDWRSLVLLVARNGENGPLVS